MTRRRALMARVESGGRLPAEYQEVEYLESTGTEYIKTGIECTSDLAVDFAFATKTIENKAFCGGINLINAPVYFRHHCSPDVATYTPFYWCQNDSLNNAAVEYGIMSGKKYEVSINPQTGTAKINATNRSFSPVRSGLTTGKDYGIFARIASDNSIQSRPVIIYYFKFYRNNVLIGNFVPCYRKADSKPGMYDLVTRNFYVNQGTGEFLYGANVN